MIKERKLDHMAIVVPDLQEALRWYEEVLGFTLKARFKSGYDMEFIYIENNGTVYELYENRNLTTSKIDHVAYESENIQEDYKYFKDKGCTFATDGIGYVDFTWDNGVDFFMILSPSNELIEFCQKR